MLLGLACQFIRIADLVLVRAEVPALRHQLRVSERQVGGKATSQPDDRILLAALSRLLPKTGSTALMPSPETLLRWHRDLVRRK